MANLTLTVAALLLTSAPMLHARAFGVSADIAAFEAGAFAQVDDRLPPDPPEPNETCPFYSGRVSPGARSSW